MPKPIFSAIQKGNPKKFYFFDVFPWFIMEAYDAKPKGIQTDFNIYK